MEKSVIIKFAKVRPDEDAVIPSKRLEDAGYDVYPSFPEDKRFLRIHSGETKMVDTNIASAIEQGYYFQVEERGSTGSKGIKKSAGVIDAGYRGEWFIALTNTTKRDLYIVKKEHMEEFNQLQSEGIINDDAIVYPYEKAIAQVVLHAVPETIEEEISYDELLKIPSERGSGKLGKSGK